MQPIFFPAFYGTSLFGNNILQVRMRPESPQGNQEAERFAELEETLHSPLERSARSESGYESALGQGEVKINAD